MPFAYSEAGERKSALVKIRLCPKCGKKLTHNFPDAAERYEKQRAKEEKNRKRARRMIEKLQRGETSSSSKRHHGRDAAAAGEGASAGDSHVKEGEGGGGEDANVWRQTAKQEATLEDEFDEYFDDMCGDLLS